MIDLQLLEIRDSNAQIALEDFNERYLEGKTDAAFGLLPQSNHPHYLAGYVSYYRDDYELHGEQNPNPRPVVVGNDEF